jgi:uncharacterized membrane protein YfcA
VIALCVWVWYVLPEPLTSQLGKPLHVRGGIPIFWLAVVSFAAAPLAIYYVQHVASRAKADAYVGVFILLLLAVLGRMLFEERREARRPRRAGKHR